MLPFDLPITQFGDGKWEVRELTKAIYDEEKKDVVVTFATPSGTTIKGGKCYIVRHDTQDLTDVEISVTNSTKFYTLEDGFDNSIGSGDNDMVEFIGTYTSGYVPVGSYFVSNNLFKEVVKPNTNKIKGFRGYFKVVNGQSARTLSLRLGENTEVGSATGGEVTVVAIYNLNGVRLNDMETGVNILQMSDGTSMKVIIK